MSRVAKVVANVYRETGYGPTREELTEILEAPHGPRSIPGVAIAQREGWIRYDEDERFIPTEQAAITGEAPQADGERGA